MDVSNGLTYFISGIPVTVIGKTGDGRIIVQSRVGLQLELFLDQLERLVDSKQAA